MPDVSKAASKAAREAHSAACERTISGYSGGKATHQQQRDYVRCVVDYRQPDHLAVAGTEALGIVLASIAMLALGLCLLSLRKI